MNVNDDEPKFKSKNQRKNQANKNNNFYWKEESDYERNESVTNDERGEIFFITKIEEPKK